MAYVTSQEIIAVYGRDVITEITDRANPPLGRIDTAILERAITAATELVDGYLAKRYQLPLEIVPIDLQEHARVLVFYNLHRGLPQSVEPEVIRVRDDALKWLQSVAEGKILLNLPSSQPVTGGGSPDFNTASRTFDNTALRGF